MHRMLEISMNSGNHNWPVIARVCFTRKKMLIFLIFHLKHISTITANAHSFSLTEMHHVMEIKWVANKFTLSLSTIPMYNAAKTKPLHKCMFVYSQVNINKKFNKHLTVAPISAKMKEELTAQDRSYSLGEFFKFSFFPPVHVDLIGLVILLGGGQFIAC